MCDAGQFSAVCCFNSYSLLLYSLNSLLFFPKDEHLGVLKSIVTTTRRWVSEGGGAGRGVGGSGGRPQPGNPGPAGRCSLFAGRERRSACVPFAADRILSTQRIPGRPEIWILSTQRVPGHLLKKSYKKRACISKNFPAARAIFSLRSYLHKEFEGATL